MKITKGLINKLIALRDGESLPASSLKGEWAEELIRDGILVSSSRGSKRIVFAADAESFILAIARIDERFADLEKTREFMADDGSSNEALRASQASDSGNSKLKLARSFPGFLVNSYEVIEVLLNDSKWVILPEEGSCVFVSDWEHFVIPSDVNVVGIENPENFRFIRKQRWLFESCIPGKRLLFVSRYPQSSDLRNWLMRIGNPYVHFGDFDLAGIKIFLSEFHRYLPERSSFLIPSDIEDRLKNGSTERFHGNYYENRHLSSDIPELQALIDLIMKYHKGYDQEGYIKK